MLFFIYFLLFSTFFCGTSSCLKIIETNFGKIRGIAKYSLNEADQYVFKGVPFAKPPIDNLRFELPEPLEPWNGILDASTNRKECMHFINNKSITLERLISEDCLYLNIYTSKRCLEASCSVLVFYSENGFRTYSDNLILQKYVSKDVIFVVPSFRLGIFGLFNIGDDNLIKENLLVHDIQVSLKFIQSEISNFGGNVKKITIMGKSFGGGIAELLTFSKTFDPSLQLFQQSIILNSPYIFNQRKLIEKKSWNFSKRAGCLSENNSLITDIVSCLKSQSAFELLSIQEEMKNENMEFDSLVRGEPYMTYEQKISEFQKNPPLRPILIGNIISSEGKSFNEQNGIELIENQFLDFANRDEVAEEYNRLIKSNNSLPSSVFVMTATYAEAMANVGGNVFLFEVNQNQLNTSFGEKNFDQNSVKNVNQYQEMFDSISSDFLIEFVKYGTPTKYWKPLNTSEMNFLNLEMDSGAEVSLSIKNNYHKLDLEFWLVNMTTFDLKITELKKASTPNIDSDNGLEKMLSEEVQNDPNFSIFNQWWLYLALFVVFVLLAFVIVEIFREKEEEDQHLLRSL